MPAQNPPPPTQYKDHLEEARTGNIHREVSKGDSELAKTFVSALLELPNKPPNPPPALSNSLQGNLAEFLVYDLGLSHWLLFDRKLSWTANATAPWKDSSDPGLDVLALVFQPADKILILEVKSSINTGTSLINQAESSLRNDFAKLFDGSSTSRLLVRIQEAMYDLKYKFERPDLLGRVATLIGNSPNTSPGVKLIGTLVCSQGVRTNMNVASRESAFNELHQWLLNEGWKSDQIEFRCIELESLSKFLTHTIKETSRDI